MNKSYNRDDYKFRGKVQRTVRNQLFLFLFQGTLSRWHKKKDNIFKATKDGCTSYKTQFGYLLKDAFCAKDLSSAFL